MEKKTILYIVGGVAVVGGIAFFLWKRSKKNTEEKTDETAKTELKDETAKTEEPKKEELAGESIKLAGTALGSASSGATPSKPTVKKLTAKELEFKLQQLCGKKPKLKKNIVLYNNCRTKYTNKLREDGYIDFTGDSESIVSNGFYSSFDDSMNLDL